MTLGGLEERRPKVWDCFDSWEELDINVGLAVWVHFASCSEFSMSCSRSRSPIQRQAGSGSTDCGHMKITAKKRGLCSADDPTKKGVSKKDKKLMTEETTQDQGEVFAKTSGSRLKQISSRH